MHAILYIRVSFSGRHFYGFAILYTSLFGAASGRHVDAGQGRVAHRGGGRNKAAETSYARVGIG